MDFMTSIQTVFGKYADFSGRARRSEYWWWILAVEVLNIIISYVVGIPALSLLLILAVIVPTIAAGVRRMHDVSKSGWFLLIPIYNLVLAVSDSTPGDNQYGPNPKGVGGFGADQAWGTPPPPPPPVG